MIETIDCLSLTITQGGVPMSDQSPFTDRRTSPAQVWARLAADYQARAIRLMAQLAFNLVAAETDSPIKESDHVVSTCHAQNPA